MMGTPGKHAPAHQDVADIETFCSTLTQMGPQIASIAAILFMDMPITGVRAEVAQIASACPAAVIASCRYGPSWPYLFITCT
jgi:hypothetical protein